MPQISKHTLNTTLWEKLWGRVAEIFSHQKKLTKKEQGFLWQGLLTPTEKVMLAKRITANLLLLSGWSEDQIGQTIKLSRTTVYKWSELLRRDKNYRRILIKLLGKPITHYQMIQTSNRTIG